MSKVVVCFGDSITYGFGLTGAGTATGETYPAGVATGLGGTWTVYNEGKTSDTLEGMNGRVSTDVTPHLTGTEFNVVVILGGINDPGINGDTAADAKAELDTLVGTILSETPSAIVLVCTLTPTNNSSLNTYRNDLNALIVASNPGDALVDFAGDSRFGDDADGSNTSLYSDGTHPTATTAGYMAELATAAIQSATSPPPPPPPPPIGSRALLWRKG